MAAPSVTLVAENGEDTLSIFGEANGTLTFDVTNEGAEFKRAQIVFALEFLQEVA